MTVTPNKTKEADKAKKVILQCMAEGMTVEQACQVAGKSIKSYEYYRKSDEVFRSLADRTRLGAVEKNFADQAALGLDFVTWRKKYLKQETFAHQKNLIDVIEPAVEEVKGKDAWTETIPHREAYLGNLAVGATFEEDVVIEETDDEAASKDKAVNIAESLRDVISCFWCFAFQIPVAVSDNINANKSPSILE